MGRSCLPLSPQEVAADGLGKGKGLNSSRYIKYVLEGPLKRCVYELNRELDGGMWWY